MVHLVLLGALTHSAMVWSTHFTQALLKTPADDRRPHPAEPAHRAAAHRRGRCRPRRGADRLVAADGRRRDGRLGRGAWHGIQLWRRLRRALPGRFRITVRYYLAAAACLPVGAALGAWLARGLDDERHGAVLVAHSMVMVLGWIGLTVTGTLVTLWPTMLRTRIDDRAERARPPGPARAAGRDRGARHRRRAGLAPGRPRRPGRLRRGAGLVGPGPRRRPPARPRPRRSPRGRSPPPSAGGSSRSRWSGGAWRPAPSWATLADGYGVVPRSWSSASPPSSSSARCPTSSRRCSAAGRRWCGRAQAWLDRGALWRVTVVNLGLLVCLLPVAERRARGGLRARARCPRRVPAAAAPGDPGGRGRPPGAAGLGRRGRRGRGAAHARTGGRPRAPRRAPSCSWPSRASPWSSPSGWPPTPPRPGWPWRPRGQRLHRRRSRRSRRGPHRPHHPRARRGARHVVLPQQPHGALRRPAGHRPGQPRRRLAARPDLRRRRPDRAGHARPRRRPSTSGWSARAPRGGADRRAPADGHGPRRRRRRARRRPPRPATRRRRRRRRHPAATAPVDLPGDPGCRGSRAVPAALPPLGRPAHPRGDADDRGGRAGGRAGGAAEALDVRRRRARARRCTGGSATPS